MPKIEKLSAMQAKDEMSKIAERSMHKWGETFDVLAKEGGAVKITGLTRGAAWGLKRTALAKGFEAKITDKGTTLVIAKPIRATPKV